MKLRLSHLPPLAAVASGSLLSLCYPGFDAGWAIWVWMVPLLLALWFPVKEKHKGRRGWRGFRLGYLAGLVFFLINLSWLSHIHIAACTLLPAFLALYFGIWGAFAATLGRPRFVDTPVDPENRDPWDTALLPAMQSTIAAALSAGAWCGLEWVRGWFLTGFGWNGLGVGLRHDAVMIQCADLVGVTGLAFIVVFVSSVAASVLLRLWREVKHGKLRPHFDFAIAVVLLVAAFFYGSGKLAQPPGKTIDLRVLLVQGGIPQDEKWDATAARKIYDKYYRMTNRYLQVADFDLVVWPESSLPFFLGETYNEDYLNDLLSIKDFELVLGLNERHLSDGYYNSIVALRGNTENARTYRKVQLVPFGEFVPLRETFPFLENIAQNAIGSDFLSGESTDPLPMSKPEPYQIIPLVCFEDTFGNLARKFVRDGEAQLIVNVTNDGWFGESAESEQHLANAMFRCIELRRPMARCANTGVTCLIDSSGSLYDRWTSPPAGERKVFDPSTGSTFIESSLPEEIRIPRNPPTTLYARFGDAFSIIGGAIALGVALAKLLVNLRMKRKQA